MQETIVRGRYVFTEPTGRDDWGVVENGAFAQKDGRIVLLGPFEEVRQRYPDATVIGNGTQVVLPGFVNAHHHIGLTTVQLGVPDLPLELWSNARVKLRGVDPYLDTLYSAFEMIGSGVTTVQHLRGAHFGNADDVHRAADACIKAYEDIGMRVSMGMGVRDQHRMHQQMDDDEFVASLPEDLRPGVRAHLGRFGVNLDDFFGIYDDMVSRYADKPLVRMQLAPPNLHWMTDRSLDVHASYSERHGALMHIHLDETQHQKEYARRRGGGSALQYLQDHGMVSSRLTLGHGVWLTERDIECLAGHGAHICHNCSSNFRLRSGIAPLNAFEKKGVNVAIGIDEAGINDDRDMLQEMRMVLNIHRVPGVGDGVPTAGQVLRMATRGGALTTPFGDEIGHLKTGAFADAVLINWDKIAKPYLDPDTGVLEAVVHRAKASGVDAVVIGGELVYENGHFTRVDRDAILTRIEEYMSRPMTRFERELHQTADAILPHVKNFYKEYVQTEHIPYYIYNSKT